MKTIHSLLIGMLVFGLASCISYQQPQTNQKSKVLPGELFPFSRTYGGKSLTYDGALDQGSLVFARNASGQLILSEPGGGHMIPETVVIPESRGLPIWQARQNGHLMLSWEKGEVRVHYRHF